jgi:hypothetical protein
MHTAQDLGKTWSKAATLHGMGCVKPRLLPLGAWDGFRPANRKGPLILSGGRLCVENVTDIFVRLCSARMKNT